MRIRYQDDMSGRESGKEPRVDDVELWTGGVPGFHDVFHVHDAVMLLVDPHSGQIVDANPKAAEFYGYTRQEMRQMRIDAINGLPIGEVANHRLAALAQRRNRFVFPHRLASGETRMVRVHSSPISWKDGRELLLSIIFNVSELHQAELAVQYQKRLLELVTRCAMDFVNLPPERMDSAISKVLAETGACFDVDRSYVFLYDHERDVMVNTHEWCAVGIEPQIANLQAIPNVAIPEWVAAHRRGELVCIEDVSKLAPTDNLRRILEPQEIQTLVTVPMMAGQRCVGFLGFDAVRNLRVWTEDEINFLRVLAELLTNVAGRRRAAEAQALQERQLRTIIDHVPGLIFAKDKDGRYLMANRAVADLFGRPSSAVVGLRDRDSDAFGLLAESYRKSDLEVLAQRKALLIPEERIPLPDGTLGWFQTVKVPYLHPGERELGVLGVSIEITARKRAEEELRLRSAALAGAANAIALTDRSGIVQWVNPAYLELTGLASSEVVGKALDLSGINGSERSDGGGVSKETVWHLVLEGDVWRGEYEAVAKNGARRIVDATLTPVRDSKGWITHFVAIMQDVTERRQLEDQLRRSQRLESLGRLAGGIAHDLNNVLSPILLGVELLRSHSGVDDKSRSLELIESSARRGAAIIRQILTFARGEAGIRLPVHLGSIVGRMVSVLQETFPKETLIEFAEDPQSWWIRADVTQIEQVFVNLCLNARDAMPNGGTVRVEIGSEILSKAKATALGMVDPGCCAVLSVTDAGEGMAADVMDQIFEPFYTTKDVGRGTGLGLSVVQGVLRAHGGAIEVFSRPGQGSCFKLYFPACEPGQSLVSSEPEAGLPVGHGELILLVDDESLVRESVRELLCRHGYLVEAASGGEEAIHVWRRRREDVRLVLSDLAMPKMDGVALLNTLRQEGCRVPIVIMTGLLPQDRVRAEMLDSADALLRKPFTARSVLESLRELLLLKRP